MANPMPYIDSPPPKVSCISFLPIPNLLSQFPTKSYLLTYFHINRLLYTATR